MPSGVPSLSDYVKIQKIGEGSYGVVYKGKHRRSGRIVAMKKINFKEAGQGVPATAIREISLLNQLHHPNIVKLEEVILEEQRLHLIFEFLTMDLKHYLGTLPTEEFLDPMLVKSYTYQICQAVCFCHQRRVLHRDLKPPNLLIDTQGAIKLADLGLARAFAIPLPVYTEEVGTLWYRAPEILLGSKRYSLPVDMWSLGCILAEMVSKQTLFHGDSVLDQLFRIFRVLGTPNETTWPGVSELPDFKPHFHKYPPNPDAINDLKLSKAGLNLLNGLLTYDPRRRWDAKKVLAHRFFADLDKTKLPAANFPLLSD